MKKQYTSPKLKAVELNAEQAIFQVCTVSGAYVTTNLAYPQCYARGISSGTRGCTRSLRGIAENYSMTITNFQALPS